MEEHACSARAGSGDKCILASGVIVFLLCLNYKSIYCHFCQCKKNNSDNMRAIYYRTANSAPISMLLNKGCSKYIEPKLYIMIQKIYVTQRIKSITPYQSCIRHDSLKERKDCGKQ